MPMNDFALITNRKRAAIALVHSIVFLLIALRGLATTVMVGPVWMSGSVSVASLLILGVYLTVTSVLLQLVRISRCAREKLYFGFCASSATFGLIRTAFGDPRHAGLYLRVIMLLCAVATGIAILYGHSRTSDADEGGL